MRRTSRALLLAFLAAVVLSPERAIAVSGATLLEDYPWEADALLGSATLKNSGERTQRQALADLLRFDLDRVALDYKGESPLVQSDGSGGWYIDIDAEILVDTGLPQFFLLKFGIGGLSGVDNTYFFMNGGDLTRLEWSNEDVDGISYERLGSFAILHDPPPLPEPATLALVGLGLAGLGFSRRRYS